MLTDERKNQLQQTLEKMRTASNAYYDAAVHTGNHTFIEFTGLMNEYIVVCQKALEQGVDFTELHRHSGERLPMQKHHFEYLAEKIDCIYGANAIEKVIEGHKRNEEKEVW